MPSSGTYLWSPELADCIDDAFERCRVDPSTLDTSHLISARRSINFMLVEWAADDNQEFRIDLLAAFALTVSVATYTIDPDTDGRIIDINKIQVKRDGVETSIYPMSRQEYLDIPDKLTEGRPSRYYANKRTTQIDLTLWPVPENSTDTLEISAMRKFQDHDAAADEPDVPYYMLEALTAGLAYRIGRKFAPESILPRLMAESTSAFKIANGAQRERGDVVIVPTSGYRRRAGGRRR